MNATFGIIGYPLKHSLSPLIHNFWFESFKLNEKYCIFEKKILDKSIIEEFIKKKIKGVSVTIPYKRQAFELSDEADETSKLLRSSNTLVFKGKKILAYNTDGLGALRAVLNKDKTLLEKPILILGTGGSARGILAELTKFQSDIFITGRNKKNGVQICEQLKNHINIEWINFDLISSIQKKVSLIIHTTPLGMMGEFENSSLLNEDFFLNQHTLFDIVYRPMETLLIKKARLKGANIILGYEMLLYQAVLQFEYFTNYKVTNEMIKKTKEKIIEKLN